MSDGSPQFAPGGYVNAPGIGGPLERFTKGGVLDAASQRVHVLHGAVNDLERMARIASANNRDVSPGDREWWHAAPQRPLIDALYLSNNLPARLNGVAAWLRALADGSDS